MFDELFYPENNSRKKRVVELLGDCITFTRNLAQDKEEIDLQIKSIDEVLKEVCENMGQNLIPHVEVKLTSSWVLKMPDSISKIQNFDNSSTFFKIVEGAYLLESGKINEDEFTNLIGLPKWFYYRDVLNETIIALGVEEVIDHIVLSTNSSNAREKLRQCISNLILPRIDLLHANLYIDNIKMILQSILVTVNSTKEKKISLEQLNTGINKIIAEGKKQNKLLTREVTIQKLNELDNQRDSYTKEDPLIERHYYAVLRGIEAMGLVAEDIDLDITDFYSYTN
ncbi:hypothetical protein [Bacillus cereus]|uniref:hypothetical protein n=1 Tax=Bacillus cereus TaxID=1396 RepID=UPI0009958222|nr:hypothetical protein [Bacillus cereus]OPA04768.1 hypothetical protein BHL31_27930 [Bacillus cereus]HDR7762368.1 hypothetical protein [Bacillus cereus]